MEEALAAEGITFAATVSYNVPQLLAVAERYQKDWLAPDRQARLPAVASQSR